MRHLLLPISFLFISGCSKYDDATQKLFVEVGKCVAQLELPDLKRELFASVDLEAKSLLQKGYDIGKSHPINEWDELVRRTEICSVKSELLSLKMSNDG